MPKYIDQVETYAASFPTIADFIGSSGIGYSRAGGKYLVVEGDYIKITSTRQVLQVLASDAVSEIAGSPVPVKLAQDSPTSLEALGATNSEDPDGRGAYAPALVTSMSSRKENGVSLRALLGSSYTPANDAAPTLSAFMAELAPAGITINDPDSLEVLCSEPVRIVSDATLDLSPNTTFLRGFADDSSDTGALFSRADWSVDTDNFTMNGGILKTVDSDQTGKLMAIYGNNIRLNRTQLLEFYGGQGIVFGGDNNRFTDLVARTESTEYGTGAFRMVGGSHFTGTNLQFKSGDDGVQFVPITGSTNARFNLDITDSYYIGGGGTSHSARGMVAIIGGPQNEFLMTCKLRRIGFIGVNVAGGNRSLVIENTEGDGSVENQIDQVNIIGCGIDGSGEDGTTAQSAYINGGFNKAIGSVNITDTTIHGTPREYGLTINAEGSQVSLNNTHSEGEACSVQVLAQCALDVNGGKYRVENNGGGNSASHVIRVDASAGAVKVNLNNNVQISGVGSSLSGLRLSSSTATANVNSVKIDKFAGATSTVGVSHASGSVTYSYDQVGSVDAAHSGSGEFIRPRDNEFNKITFLDPDNGGLSSAFLQFAGNTDPESLPDQLPFVLAMNSANAVRSAGLHWHSNSASGDNWQALQVSTKASPSELREITDNSNVGRSPEGFQIYSTSHASTLVRNGSARPYTWNFMDGQIAVIAGIGIGGAAQGTWVASSVSGEFYLDTGSALTDVSQVIEGDRMWLSSGTVGSLSDGEYAVADNDSIGYSTIYVRPFNTDTTLSVMGADDIRYRNVSHGAITAVGRQVYWNSAAPTTGYYFNGDIVYDNSPVSGQPMGWMCTAKGHSGTWVAMADLA